MPRDSLFGERIVWSGSPRNIAAPKTARALSALFFLVAAISTSYAFVLGLALHANPLASIVFAMWTATLGFVCRYGPPYWLQGVRYIVTENHVIWQRGPFRRSIERRSISYARIFRDPKNPRIGDLELIRAVPTGALRRRLALHLSAVEAPERVWAIVRGEEDVAPVGSGDNALAQRLDVGERVLWSAKARSRLKAYLPQNSRQWALLAIAAFLFAAAVRFVWRGFGAVEKVLAGGLPPGSFAFVALVFALTTSLAVVLSVAGYIIYDTNIRPGRMASETRYMITNKRVLIQRGLEELHLDRAKIVDVIDTPVGPGLSDVFLVLDGPRARALAASGAFGEITRGPHLRPVFEAIDDAESASRILKAPELSHAA